MIILNLTKLECSLAKTNKNCKLSTSQSRKKSPIKKKRVRNSKAPWLTPEIKRLMWERDKTKRIATITNDQLKWTEYRRLKNRVNHSIKASKKAYYHSYFEDNAGKAKPTWNGINTLLSRKKNLIIGEAAITDPLELSNAFNRHFTDIGPNLASQINLPRVSFRDFVKSCDSTFELELLTYQLPLTSCENLSTIYLWARLMASMVFQLPS